MATENPTWSCSWIQGALKNLDRADPERTGHPACAGPVDVVAHVSPSALGKIAGADFFTTEVWTSRGPVTYYALFVLEFRTRRLNVAGSTPNPDAAFMAQAARCLTDAVDGFLGGWRALICDRDRTWTDRFRGVLRQNLVRSA